MRASNKSVVFMGNVLPSEYQQVEYLESHGTEWIDTGIVPSANMSVEFRGAYTNTYGGSLLGTAARPGGTLDRATVLRVYSTQTTTHNQRAYTDSWNTISYSTNWHIYRNTPTYRAIDDIVYTTSTPVLAASIVPIALFCQREQDSSEQLITSNYSSAKISYCRLWDNNTLVRSLIPARRKSDSVLGMYDLVTNTFFTNKGTGTFTCGADVYHNISSRKSIVPCKVLPEGYKRLEYIQSSGNQYIDTGIVPSATSMELEHKVMFLAYSNYVTSFGCGENGKYSYFLALYYGQGIYDNIEKVYNPIYDSSYSKFLFKDIYQHTVILNGIYTGSIQYDEDTITKTISYNTSNIPTTNTLYMFCTHYRDNTPKYFLCGRYYFLKLKKDNTLVRNFIPSQRLSDNAVGMYDTVTNTFFENQGTGSFIAGPEVSNYDYISSNKQIIYENSN